MGEIDIIEVIKRRQAKFQAQRRSGPQEHMDEAARWIAEEYDSLLAEIEASRSMKLKQENATADRSRAESDNNIAEAEILGDQGQSGG